MQDRFRVALGRVAMTPLLQGGAEFEVVVNFAVKHNPDIPLLIPHRLASPGEINNAQPAKPKRYLAGDKAALVVRPAVVEDTRHGLQISAWKLTTSYDDNSTDPAHRFNFR